MSIIKMMDRLNQKLCSVISATNSLQIATVLIWLVGRTLAFKAALALLKRNLYHIVDVYIKCKSQDFDSDVVNYVTAIYEPFTHKRYLIKADLQIKAEVKIIFQTVEDTCLS
jgi:amidophosphoribosyltransferase